MNTQDNHQLVIKNSVLIWRIAGLIAALLSGGSFYFWHSQTHLFKDLDLLFVIVGLLMVFTSADLTIIAERSTRTLRLEYQYLLYHNARVIPFDDIENIHTVKSTSNSNGHSSTTYRIVATLKNGKNIPFRSISSGGNEYIHQAARLQAFISRKTSLRESKAIAEIAPDTGSDQPVETNRTNEVPPSEKPASGSPSL